jgi:hypothetical protein
VSIHARHGGRDTQALVNVDEIVPKRIERHHMAVVFEIFLLTAFVNQVKRRLAMRIVRFARSA